MHEDIGKKITLKMEELLAAELALNNSEFLKGDPADFIAMLSSIAGGLCVHIFSYLKIIQAIDNFDVFVDTFFEVTKQHIKDFKPVVRYEKMN